MSTETETIAWMSCTIPKISLICMSFLIARMSVELSESILILSTSRFTTAISPRRRARASAMSGDLTKSCTAVPLLLRWCVGSEIAHPKPALFVLLFQAASVLHVTLVPCDSWVDSVAGLLGTVFVVFLMDPWALFHSLASLSPFVATSLAYRVRFSKITKLRAFQITQQIQGRILPEIPVGGRHTDLLNLITISLKSELVARWTTWCRGINFHTSCAKAQLKKVCTAVSFSLHLTHRPADWTPLLCRLSPSGRAFWMIDHRKTFIFGEHTPDHTSLIQSKSRLRFVGFWEAFEVSAAVLYPYLVEYIPDWSGCHM